MNHRGIDLQNEEDLVDVYADILLNLETAIHDVAYPESNIGDGQVELALERLIRHYQAEAAGRQPGRSRLTGKTQDIFDATRSVGEYMLGRTEAFDAQTHESVGQINDPIDYDVLIACLKRIRKSVKYWNKLSGRRGYITYVHLFLAGELPY